MLIVRFLKQSFLRTMENEALVDHVKKSGIRIPTQRDADRIATLIFSICSITSQVWIF